MGGGGCGDVLSSIAVLSAKHEMEVGCPVMIEGGGGIPVHPYMVPEGPPPLYLALNAASDKWGGGLPLTKAHVQERADRENGGCGVPGQNGENQNNEPRQLLHMLRTLMLSTLGSGSAGSSGCWGVCGVSRTAGVCRSAGVCRTVS